MARALKCILTLCLALGLTSIVWGQAQQPPQPNVLGPVLSIPGVQKELKLSDEQIGKLKDALGKVMEKYKDNFTKFPQMSAEEQQKTMKTLVEDSHKAIASVLDDKQVKRFRQIEWQIAGIAALGDPKLQEELKLSDEQKKKLEGIFKDTETKMRELFKNRESPEKLQEKYQTIAKDLDEKVNGVLTDDQKKNLKDLKGPPFQIAPPAKSEK